MIQIVNANNLTKISGIISNPINSKVYICYYNIITFDQIIVDSAQLDINGKFSMTFVWPNYNHMVFIHESINVNLYINPKDNIELEFDADNFNKSIKCYGIGGAVNNYLVQKLLIFNKNYPTSIYKLNEKDFIQFIDSTENEKLIHLNNFFSKLKKNKKLVKFLKYEEAEIIYSTVNAKYTYPSLYSYMNGLKSPVLLSSNYYNFLNHILVQNIKAFNAYSYLEFIENYFKTEVQKMFLLDSTQNIVELQERFLENNFSGCIKDYLYSKWIYNLLTRKNDLQNASIVFSKFKNSSKNKSLIELLTMTFINTSRMAIGEIAPNFTYYDINGKLTSLSDFKGKLIYLDIWASWCGPCIKEIPYTKKLQEKLKNRNIEFLFISVDRDPNKWKTFVNKELLQGTHLLSSHDYSINIEKLYNVKSFPRYFIIGADGKILDNIAKRPSQEVILDLERYLKD
ncbi:MAG: TlpA family protein disulfide reductase [Saprospiraceae bacterium]|nr:TlpA family protein disulfide reductase [Saprospiraceae bacterium]